MHFHLKINTDSIQQFNEEILRVEGMDDFEWVENRLILSDADLHSKVFPINGRYRTGWLIGDPIIEKDKAGLVKKYFEESDYTNLIQTISSHYRMIVFDKKKFTITVTSSLFGILPVYYHRAGKEIYISSDAELLSEETGQNKTNKRFILENILFYYPLFNQTAYHNIHLLPAHHALEISEKETKFFKHTDVAGWFAQQPRSWKESTGYISDVFIKRVKCYLPDEKYIHSLTGGFDSRTLVSCGLHYQKIFETYGFGNELSDDTMIAAKLASAADLKFNLIKLDNDYVSNHSLECGLQFIKNSGGYGGFARAHYLFACRAMSQKSKYLVTGNFGSEIFRAAHNAGAVISGNLYHLFNSRSVDEALQKIEESPEFLWINRRHMKQEWEELKSELSRLPVFSNEYSGMPLNQKFYLLVFEEVFRKYFGAEMVNQFVYLNNRTPFLDAEFLKEILKTGLAGVHSDFFENNPLKRYKGQVLYAHFIMKAYPAFNEVLTDKGYKPKDLLSIRGKLHITRGYFKKRLGASKDEIDPNSVDAAFVYNRAFFEKQTVSPEIFNISQFDKAFKKGNPAHDFLIALSQSWFLNSNQEPNKVKLSFNLH